jgi:hypothetical protein
MHDQTAVRTEGITEQFRQHPAVKAIFDDGYRGARERVPRPGLGPAPQAEGPGRRHRALTERYGWREHRRRQSSRRICVEHANAEHRQWRPLQRYTQRRETYGETHRAIAALVCDRSVKRTTRRRPSTELVHVRTTTC